MHKFTSPFLTLLCLSLVASLKHTNLTIGGIFPMSGYWAGGIGCKPAVEMALKDVNNRMDILPDYHLLMESDDSRCLPGLGTKVLYKLLYQSPTKMMVLSGCSIVSTFVAQAAKMWNLVVLGYGSSSPALSNRERFPTFFRTHPSATLHNPTRVKLFQKFKWTKIATIQETQEVFTSTVEDLEERVKAANIEVSVRQNFLSNPANAVRNLKRQDARIIVGVFYENMARQVFCQAYKERLYGKKYVWFIIGWYPDNWYKKSDPKVNCTADQLKEALEGHFTTEAVVLHQDNSKTISDMRSQDFTERLDKKLKEKNYKDMTQVDGYPEAPLAYDAVWALALAFDRTAKRLKARGLKLDDFNYHNQEIREEIYAAMNSTSFLGVSGNVAFSSEGDRIAWTQIEQMINGTYNKLGYYDSSTDNLTWFNKEKWIGNKVPPDHTLIVSSPRVVSRGLFLSMCFLAGIGTLFGIFCLLFNVVNRKRRCIVYSQPEMNTVTVFGCIVCQLCIFLLGLDIQYISRHLYPVVCQIRAWMLSIGFTFAYGGMFSKIWTVHRMTTGKKDKKILKGLEVFTVLTTLLAMDIVVLSTWQIVDPLYRRVDVFEMEDPADTDNDIKLQPELEHCAANHLSIWLGVIFGYKGILLLFGIFLAYETRSVKLKHVNDSRFVVMSIYNVVVLCVITAPITLIIGSQQDASFAFVSLAILLSSFLSMGLIFVPKGIFVSGLEVVALRDLIVDVIRNPYKNMDIQSLAENLANQEEEDKHQKLLKENDQLKKQISQVEDRIKELRAQLEIRTQQRVQLSMAQFKKNSIANNDLGNNVHKNQSFHCDLSHPLPQNHGTASYPNCNQMSSADFEYLKSNLTGSDSDLEYL